MKSPEIDQNSFSASASSRVESACCGDGEGIPPDSPRRISGSSPRSGRSLIEVDALRFWSSAEILTCDWEKVSFHRRWHFLCIEPFGVEFWCVHLLQLFNVCCWNVSFPNSPRVQYILGEKTGKTFGPNWCNLDMSFAEIGCYSTIAPNGRTGPLSSFPKRLSYGVFPPDKRSWMFRK